MAIKRYKADRRGIANGKTTPQACNEAAITVQTYYRWRKEYRDFWARAEANARRSARKP